MPRTLKTCSICGGNISIQPLTGWADGHNALPINHGRCCDACNATAVIPARIAGIDVPEQAS